MHSQRIISYIRVSTKKQGVSGLGIEGQRAAIKAYADQHGAEIIAEYVEVETGKKDDRPQLSKALHHAKITGSKTVIAKLDRLSRCAAFLLNLSKSGADIHALDIPDSNPMMFGIMAVVAQAERKAISDRTKAALAALKERGVRLGNPNGAAALKRAGKGNAASTEAKKVKADAFAENIRVIIEAIKADGHTTLAAIAAELNARHIQTARGGQWHASSVANLIARLSLEEGA